MKYYSAKTVTQILGVTAQTLRNWDKEGKLKPAYTKSNGYRYYSEEDVLAYTKERDRKKERKLVGYVRVTSKKQENDLKRQKENLEEYLKQTNQEYEIISDILLLNDNFMIINDLSNTYIHEWDLHGISNLKIEKVRRK